MLQLAPKIVNKEYKCHWLRAKVLSEGSGQKIEGEGNV